MGELEAGGAEWRGMGSKPFLWAPRNKGWEGRERSAEGPRGTGDEHRYRNTARGIHAPVRTHFMSAFAHRTHPWAAIGNRLSRTQIHAPASVTCGSAVRPPAPRPQRDPFPAPHHQAQAGSPLTSQPSQHPARPLSPLLRARSLPKAWPSEEASPCSVPRGALLAQHPVPERSDRPFKNANYRNE